MTSKRTIPVKLAALPRDNPMVWHDQGPQGLAGAEDGLALLGTPPLESPRPPRLPEGFRPDATLRNGFAELARALRAAAAGAVPDWHLDLTALDDDSRLAVAEVLGQGEVTGEVTLDGVEWRLTESVLTGVWRLRSSGGADRIEVGAVPSVVRTAADSLRAAPLRLPESPPNVMNGLPVLAEISDRAAGWTPGAPNHVLNFTLLPLSEGDQDLLTGTLGRARLTLTSGGFGTCRIMATTVRHVWAVQYLNAMGNTILDTVEIGDVPEAATASATDFEDSAARLDEILRAYLS